MDKRVEIHGTSRADMNGKRGVATDFHPIGATQVLSQDDPNFLGWRYTVQLDSGGGAFKVKRENVRAEPGRAPVGEPRKQGQETDAHTHARESSAGGLRRI